MNVAPPTDAAAMAEWRVTTDASETRHRRPFSRWDLTTALPTAPTFSTVATLSAGRTLTDELTVFIAGFGENRKVDRGMSRTPDRLW